MRKMERPSEEAEKAVRDIRRATRRQYSAEEFTKWARLEAEILLLRQQLVMLRRRSADARHCGTSIAYCWYCCIDCTHRSLTRSSSG